MRRAGSDEQDARKGTGTSRAANGRGWSSYAFAQDLTNEQEIYCPGVRIHNRLTQWTASVV
jgi:hypothetical protein